MGMISKIGTVLRGTPLYGPAERLHQTGLTIREKLVDIYVTKRLRPEGFYTINPSSKEIEPFDIWLLGGDKLQRARIQGRLEPHVMDALAERVDESTVFWEVGAAWGYFSLSMATVADSVKSFEIDSHRAGLIKRSVEKNCFTNVEVIQGTVGNDISLDKYELPDLVLLDIEGWEYEALSNSPKLLSATPEMIIEIHEDPSSCPGDPEIDPGGVKELLKEYEYDIQIIGKRNDNNYHILVE